MRAGIAIFLLVALVTAGCVAEPDAEAPEPAETQPEAKPRLPVLRMNATGGAMALDEADLATPVYFVPGFNGAEPNMGITSSGAVYATANSHIVRSADKGETFAIVHTHVLPNSDPMMWVDVWTDQIYNAPMFPILLCATIYKSADDGTTWDTVPHPNCGRGVYDHQKLASGPPGPDAPPAAGLLHPSVLYVCYNALVHTQCAVSYDDGDTWPHDRPVPVSGCSGINGHPTVSNEGIVVVPKALGCSAPHIAYSTDSGLTWTVQRGPQGVGSDMIDPEVAFTPDGTLYLLFRGGDRQVYLGRTTDLGETWDGPWRVSPNGTTSTVFGALGAGDDGRIAMSFLATSHPEADYPSEAPADTRWHLWMVTSDDAASDDPTFTAYQVTPGEDPVQIGCVWLEGGGEPCRNMLDFIDGAVHPDGTWFTAYTEGCHEGCAHETDATDEDSRGRNLGIARLDGFSLYAEAASEDVMTPDDP